MTRSERRAWWIAGIAVAVVLAVTALIWGVSGVEVVSWLAGIGSLVVAVVVLFIARPAEGGRGQVAATPAAGPATPAAGSAAPAPEFVPRELPAVSEIFVDRVDELDRLTRTLCRASSPATHPGPPIVVLSGLGGIGKTTLAIRVGHSVREQFPNGQFFVDLAGYGANPLDPISVQGEFLRALGITDLPERAEEQTRLYRSRLADGRFLMVLDNARSDEQVTPLLPSGSGSAVIVTSRSRLALLDTPHRFQLGVLDEDDSVLLLRRVIGDDRVAAQHADAALIAHGCGGFPLALRVAAARLALRPSWRLASLAGRLQDESRRLRELNMGNIEARAGFAFSYQNLTRDEQQLYRLIGMLDSVTLPTWVAAALLDVSLTDAEELVERLAEADLLTTDGPGSYRMHDILRVFARERLAEETAPAEREAALGRVLAAYFALAEEADGGFSRRNSAIWDRPEGWPLTVARDELIAEVAPGAEWLDAERANVMALIAQAVSAGQQPWAWRLASAFWQYFEFANRWPDWFRAFDLASRAAQQAGDPVAQSLTLRYLGAWARARGRTAEAEAYLTQALSKVDGDTPSLPRQMALKELSVVERLRGRHAAAVTLLNTSIEGLRQLGEDFWVACNLREIGIEYRYLGRSDDARASFTAAIAAFDEMDEASQAAGTRLFLGVQERLDGRLDRATAAVEHALTYFERAGRTDMMLTAVREIGVIQREQGRYADAIASFERCLSGWADMDHPLQQTATLHELATTYLAQGRPDLAMTAAEQTRAGYAALDDQRNAAAATVTLAEAELARGMAETARARLTEVLPDLRARGETAVQVAALRVLAKAHTALDNPTEAAAAERTLAALETPTADPDPGPDEIPA